MRSQSEMLRDKLKLTKIHGGTKPLVKFVRAPCVGCAVWKFTWGGSKSNEEKHCKLENRRKNARSIHNCGVHYLSLARFAMEENTPLRL